MEYIEEIDKILDKERQILLSGKFDELVEIIHSKVKVFTYLESADLDLPASSRSYILEKAKINEALLKATQNGIRSAIVQIEKILSSGGQSTYSCDGKICPLVVTPRKIGKKL